MKKGFILKLLLATFHAIAPMVLLNYIAFADLELLRKKWRTENIQLAVTTAKLPLKFARFTSLSCGIQKYIKR